MKGSESAPVDSYLAVGEEVHLASLDEGLQLDVRLRADRAALPRLADHGEPPQQALLAVELSQVGPSVQLDAVLHVGVAAHQTLHVAHVKLLQLENPGGRTQENPCLITGRAERSWSTLIRRLPACRSASGRTLCISTVSHNIKHTIRETF